jgi:hypothetical protein
MAAFNGVGSPRWTTAGRSSALAALVAAVVAAGVGAGTVRTPLVAYVVIALGFIVVVTKCLSPPTLLLATLAYVVLGGPLLDLAPPAAIPFLRYAPEILGYGWLGLLVLTRGGELYARARPFVWALGALLTAGVTSAISAAEWPSTAIIGIRSEIRYVPYALIACVVLSRAADRRRLARLVFYIGVIEAVLGAADYAFGEQFTRIFRPDYTVQIDGVEVLPRADLVVHSITGTLTNYNTMAAVIVAAIVVTITAGHEVLGVSTLAYRASLVAMVFTVVLSGSREGLLALGIALIVWAWMTRRMGLPLTVIALVSFAAILNPLAASNQDVYISSRSILTRWQALLQPDTLTFSSKQNFRLRLLATEAHLTEARGLLTGAGPGSVVDRRTIANGSNPLFQTADGRTALEFNYQYDGNWGLILLEFGVLGITAFIAIFVILIGLGRRRRSEWPGQATSMLAVTFLILGFFTAILQLPEPTLIFWLIAGSAFAADADERSEYHASGSRGTP